MPDLPIGSDGPPIVILVKAPIRAPETTAGSARGDVIGAAIAALLVAVAFVVPRLANEQWRASLNAATAPIFGGWQPRVGWGTLPALLIAALVVQYGPAVANRVRWPLLLLSTWLVAIAWSLALAFVDGWRRGFSERLTDPNEYLHEVEGVTDIPAMVRGFSERILDFQPDSWTTHVSGHPPGALLIFALLDRAGLTGGGWAGVLCVIVGCSAAVAVLISVRTLASEEAARSAAPFLALAPAAVWIAVSADALFAGITAWAIALLALAATSAVAFPMLTAVCAGLLFGLGVYVNYGLILMGIPAIAVLVAARNYRPLVPAIVGALAVACVFTAAGFWWLDGYHLVVERYYQGIASQRPFDYWVWGNIAAATCATGLAVPAALHRTLAPSLIRARDGLSLLVGAAVCAIVAADLSALSKAETERIWLPFTIWLLAATALLPSRHRRIWLVVQVAGTLTLVHLVFTNW